MLTSRDLPARAATLQLRTPVTHDFAAARQRSRRDVQALLDAVRDRVCAAGEVVAVLEALVQEGRLDRASANTMEAQMLAHTTREGGWLASPVAQT